MCDKQLEVIKKQFFCGVPVTEIDWKDFLEHLSWEDQELFIQQTVDSSDNILHPLRVSYQKAFVKYVLDRLGTSEAVHDVVYNAFGRLVATPNTGDSFKHYRVSEQLNLILKENANFISEGTTGLCTWQAGIALAEWCVQNQEIFKGKTLHLAQKLRKS
ncbi:PREDICTED: protein-lysine N-methyltransferase EEF2KMT isoform X1 [Nicrophorus vespilloides]|uniref:Protein-lysine N-methyltransferase EEF2KMT isoform X1 n=1 Tax=Nicrophorus vespilloides TaxID=110193 RepID=A0ABM1M4Q3_NICVS|nr:PREDICTED: protein-lysine N-methyltransferase EEF2KMT isoform X1 [Nicrophorus vespilloides]